MAILNFPDTTGQPIDGSFTYQDNGILYIWDGYKWTADAGSSGGNGNHTDGPTPPTTGEVADQWFNTDDGRLYTYTEDSSGTLVWIDASPDSIAGDGGGGGTTTPGVRYQEGDWTPATASGTLSFTESYTHWSRTGNKVTLWADLSSFSSTSGDIIEITQLPYEVAFPSSVGSTFYVFGKAGYPVITATPSGSYNGGTLKFNSPSAAGADNLKYSNLNNGFIAQVIATYYTNDTTFVPINSAVVTEDIQGTGGGGSGGGVGADAWGSVASDGSLKGGMNIASVVRTGSGAANNYQYAVTFTTPMPNADYSVVGSSTTNGVTNQWFQFQNKTVNGFNVVLVTVAVTAAASDFDFTVHASSTVTPTYTWTRDGTTLKPANDGDDVEVSGNVFSEGAIASTRFGVTTQLASEETINGETKQLAFAAKNGSNVYRAALDYSGSLSLGGDAWSSPNISLNADGKVNAVGMSLGVAYRSILPADGFLLVDKGVYIGSFAGESLLREVSQGSGSNPIYIGNQQIQVSSDVRLKTDIEDTKVDATERLKEVRVVDFAWDDPSDEAFNNKNARGRWTGVLAQELVDIFPFAVNAPRSLKTRGAIDHESEIRWNVNQDQLVPVLIKGFQEQQAKIEALEAKVTSLEGGN